MTMLTIYGDSISGNCLKVKFVCDRLGIAYRWVETSVLKSETRTAEFLVMNPAGQVPVVKFADGRILSQSNAIILYLAENSDLIPAEAYDRALMFQWLFWEQYSHETVIAVRRFHKTFLKKPDAEIDPALLPASAGERERLLTACELEKALYELRYELDNRPDWVGIPVTGILRLIEQAAATR